MATIPQNVAFEQARQELIGCVNYCINTLGLKMYETEIILRDLYNDAFAQAQREYEADRRAYEEQLRAEQEAETEVDKETE